uniref:Dynein regulatory complex subunit 1 homolog (Chlamydomonas) n=1 Tax=Echeneis naucrates TaxID=173247 RepID=A0A665X0R2_ECHNA
SSLRMSGRVCLNRSVFDSSNELSIMLSPTNLGYKVLRITNLQRDLTMFVTNIQTAADARESARRKEVEEAHRIRMERVESHEKSSQEKFEEITRGWMIVKEKATLQELREAQSSQQEQCALLLEDKRKFINDLQQELKCGDDRYVKDLRKEAEELNVMIERMDDHMKTLKKAYREEMSQIKVGLHLGQKGPLLQTVGYIDLDKWGVLHVIVVLLFEMSQQLFDRFLQLELQNLQSQYASHVKWIRDTRQCLSKQIKSSIKQPIAVASARKFEEMWLAVEAEVKQLVERALLTDSLICEQYLGIAWERPQMAFMELSGPIHPQKQGPETESKLLTAGRGESDIYCWHDNQRSAFLLCQSFLMEDRVLKLLAPLEKEEQIGKLNHNTILLQAFGVEEEDVPKLANFFMNYKEQHQDDQAETSDLIHPNHVLPALKAFLEQQIRWRFDSWENSNSGPQVEARDSSEDEAYWERLGSIISDDRIKVWEVAENRLNQYL